MRYPTGLENIVRLATLSATNVVASQAWELLSRSALGGGTVTLAGSSYTGADDATVDIEVTSTTINGAPRLSTPVYAGVGSGTLTGLSADSGIDAQTFTVTCLSTGTPTRQAWAPFQSVTLRAVDAGPDGNNLSLRVDQSTLVATATDYSTTSAMSAGASRFDGDQHNFGAVNLEPEGTVPAAAPRIRFGDDITVYRHWRKFDTLTGLYSYFVSPALRRDVPIGTRVYAITGGRTVTVLDGVTEEETYTSVGTLYALLSDLQADSALLEVDGVVAEDRRPGGMACDDLSVYTASYSAGSTRDGSSYIRRAVIPLTVDAGAPTEILRLECINAGIPGAEIWSVVGSVSEALGTVVTGEAFAAGEYGFTVPVETAPNEEPPGEFVATLDLQSRDSGAQIPSLCVKNPRLGAEAQSRTYTFIWRPHPGEACPCENEPVQGGPNNDFLGITTGAPAVATLPAAIKTLYQEIEEWRYQSINLNCYFTSTDDDTFITSLLSGLHAAVSTSTLPISDTLTDGLATILFQRVSAIAKFEQADIDAIELVANLFQQHLLAIYNEMGGEGDLDASVETEFQAQWDAIVDKLTPLMVVTNNGGPTWKTTAFSQLQMPSASEGTPEAYLEAWIMKAIEGARNLTRDLIPLTKLCQAAIGNVYVAGNLLRPFEVATRTGNAVWQDHNLPFWFVSEDGLLPVQPGYYYHSARMVRDEDGNEVPEATREFGFGPAIGCVESMVVGDRLIITTTPRSNARGTYQQGDAIEWQIVRADPVQLGGGQTGDDTLTFGVRGSVVGALDDYLLVTTAPTGYSDGGLTLTITPGAIDWQPGDRWTFAAEGGEFRWRVNGGSWTTADIAATVSLSSGIVATFVAGATPSWLDGDTYQLSMLASSGAGRVRKPDDESLAWTGSTQIDITPAGSGEADTLVIAAHTIPSSATVTLSGSNDNWATTAFSQAVTWAQGSMALLFTATTCAKWRLTVNAAGSIDWLYLGVPERPIVSGTSTVEHGVWRRRARLANAQRNRALGGTVTHTDCSQASIDALCDALEYAHQYDDGRIGAVSPEGEATLVTVADEIDIDDAYGFQSPSADRRLNLSMTLTPR